MDELREELSATLDEGSSEEQTLEQTGQLEPSQDEANQAAEAYWQKHDNYKKGFWKSEEDVIKGYDYYDKKFKPFETVLKQRGIQDHNGLTEILSKYDEYSDPNSEINISYNSLQNLVNHPTYGKEFQDFVNRIAEQEEVERYGARLPQEVKQKLQEVEQLKQWKQELEQKEKVAEFTSKLDETCNQIEEFCKTKGYELGENEMKEHLLECLDKQIYGENIYNYFVSKNLDKILGTVQSKTSQAIASNLSKNNKAAVPSGSRVASSQTADVPSSSDGLHSYLHKIANKGE